MQISINNISAKISILLIVLPRAVVIYPLYFIATMMLFNYNDVKALKNLLLITSVILFAFMITSYFYYVSWTGLLVEVFLVFPFLILISGFKSSNSKYYSISSLRILNVVIFILSLFSLTQQGFPFKLPYIDFLPDYYNALYGLGGAKIVTVIGYFGFIAELYLLKCSKQNNLIILITLTNFLMPSYLMGIVVGGISMLPFYRKSKILMLILIMAALIITPYAIYRLNTLGFQTLSDIPKLKAYYILFTLYEIYPSTLFLGTGLGQYIGQSALWSSKFISELSSHAIPNLPFFHMSEFHIKTYGPYFSAIKSYWDISSSAQKPYSSIIAILGEFGVVLSLFLLFGFYKVISRVISKDIRFGLIMFVFGMFALDIWHDNFFFIYALFLCLSVVSEEIENE